MLNYPLDLIARVLDAAAEGDTSGTVLRACTDSRQVRPGDLFFAIRGERFDGHGFVEQAFACGAVGCVVERGRAGMPVGRPGALLSVPDPLLALGTLGAWHRNRFRGLRVVGVTGSLGKTTTKDLIASVLRKRLRTLKNPGNLNAEIGVPLTLLEIRPEHEVAVVEMAMRGLGQIRYLARLARPDVAVITNIGLSHLELLGTQDAIAAAKAEILEFLPLDGTAILNGDDRYADFLLSKLPPGARAVFFGAHSPRVRVRAEYVRAEPMSGPAGGDDALGSGFELSFGDSERPMNVWLPMLGRHNVVNAAAAAAVGAEFGIEPIEIAFGLAEADVSKMRMAVHRLRDGSMIIDDAYNASDPATMIAALDVLAELPGARKLAVLGSMLELGPASDDAHRKVGEHVASVSPSALVTVGDRAAAIADSAVARGYAGGLVFRCATNEDAEAVIAQQRRPGDIILVKGSRGVAMESLIARLCGEGAD